MSERVQASSSARLYQLSGMRSWPRRRTRRLPVLGNPGVLRLSDWPGARRRTCARRSTCGVMFPPVRFFARSSSSWAKTGYEAQLEFISGASQSPRVMEASASVFKCPRPRELVSSEWKRVAVLSRPNASHSPVLTDSAVAIPSRGRYLAARQLRYNTDSQPAQGPLISPGPGARNSCSPEVETRWDSGSNLSYRAWDGLPGYSGNGTRAGTPTWPASIHVSNASQQCEGSLPQGVVIRSDTFASWSMPVVRFANKVSRVSWPWHSITPWASSRERRPEMESTAPCTRNPVKLVNRQWPLKMTVACQWYRYLFPVRQAIDDVLKCRLKADL
ncbi:hypothetical protein KC324_g2 [Hortaea werneckii]|nr:hypothetical protein KC324_g2 [Hortaea werneckii]